MYRNAIHDERLNETYLPEGATADCGHDCANCTPADCEAWRQTALICPACLEFKARGYPQSSFTQSMLLVNDEGGHLCPGCGEVYSDVSDIVTRAIDNLKDALDNQAWEATQRGAA